MPFDIRVAEWLSVRKRAADLDALRDLVVPSAEVRLLDVGGGAGAATERLASGCGEIVVVDPDARKVALGRRLRPAIRFEEGQAEDLPFPDGSFDRVVAVVAFHHTEDQAKALAEMRRVLRPSGRIVFFELPPGRAPGPLLRWIAGLRHWGPTSFLEPEELKAKLEAGGFQGTTTRMGVRGYFVSASKARSVPSGSHHA